VDPMALHLIKLCVGADSVEALHDWRRANGADPEWKVHTRQTPRRAAELVEGGSIYRVFKGLILCRQRILRVDTVGEGAQARCHIVVDHETVRVVPTPRRPFQGWRYLDAAEAPADVGGADDPAAALPLELTVRLRELGAW
jgi:hypothetical protein